MSKFLVGQIGIPRHSAVAKMLYEENLLDQFIVDTYFSKKSILANLPVIGPKLVTNLKKYDPEFPSNMVRGDWYGALKFRNLLKKSKRIEAFKFANQRLGNRLINYAKNKKPGKYFGFDTTSLNFLEWSYDKGWENYLEQCVAPRSTQIRMWELFEKKYNIDYSGIIEYTRFQQEVERKEWQYAKHIIVPSEFVKSELMKEEGLDINKVHVINYGYTPLEDKGVITQGIEEKFSGKTGNPIHILFAGNAGYRKGVADLVTLATDLKDENLRFTIAGLLEEEAQKLINEYPYNNINFVGKLSREHLANQYMNSDIFFFPSYLEGSALVLIEAMSWGLPVVTTYQSGSVIKDEVDGFISESGDIESFKKNILKLASNAQLRYNMGMSALKASASYSVENYGQNLLNLFTKDVK